MYCFEIRSIHSNVSLMAKLWNLFQGSMTSSIKVFNIPRGFEQDLARLILNRQFELTSLAVNHSAPYDTVFEFKDPAIGEALASFINRDIKHIRGQAVELKAEMVSSIKTPGV